MTPPEQAIAARLTAIAERLKAGVDGEWRIAASKDEAEWWWSNHPRDPETVVVTSEGRAIACTNDDGIATMGEVWAATFIANAPADVRFLLAHVETLTQQVAELRAELKESEAEYHVANEEATEFKTCYQNCDKRAAKVEQQRDAAHAALTIIAECPPEAVHLMPLAAQAALAASAPQKEEK